MSGSLSRIVGAVVATAALAAPALAQSWPEKPVRMIVGYGAGGGTDQQARALSKILSEQLGQPFVVENKPGGGGAVGAMLAKAAPADGYTLYFTTSTTYTFEPLFAKVGYGASDLRHVAVVAQFQEAMVASPKAPWKDFREMVEKAKAEKRDIKYASFYQLDRVIMAAIAKSAGIRIVPVPVQSGNGVVTAVMGEQVDFGFTGGSWGPFVQSGQLKLLAAGPSDRFADYPQVPTLKDLGYDVITEVYTLVSVPKDTPEPVVKKIEAAITQAAGNPAYVDAVVNVGKMRHIVAGEKQSSEMVQRQEAYYRKLAESVGQGGN
jgi:tripartite-type tricarboxylate transporter receptor subunit TctC